jgi:hypothetical protein
MSDKPKSSFLAQNPERLMIILFPLITLSLFIVAAVLWWIITTQLVH